jgi:hypothetical protein
MHNVLCKQFSNGRFRVNLKTYHLHNIKYRLVSLKLQISGSALIKIKDQVYLKTFKTLNVGRSRAAVSGMPRKILKSQNLGA